MLEKVQLRTNIDATTIKTERRQMRDSQMNESQMRNRNNAKQEFPGIFNWKTQFHDQDEGDKRVRTTAGL